MPKKLKMDNGQLTILEILKSPIKRIINHQNTTLITE